MWYEIREGKITGSFIDPPDPTPADIRELPDSDPLVQDWLGPEWSRQPFQEYVISSIEDLLNVSNAFSFWQPYWGFRGQSNYAHELENALERNTIADLRSQFGLAMFERRILIEAKRRARHYYQHLPEDLDTLGWFSLLRHQGVATRLLDISWSIFIACYFAVSAQRELDGAIWAFNQRKLKARLQIEILNNRDHLFRESPGVLLDEYQGATLSPTQGEKEVIDAKAIRMALATDIPRLFDLATQGVFAVKGVAFAEPMWVNKRQDLQQGAFLFPLNCTENTHSNLMSMLSLEAFEHETPEGISSFTSAVPFTRQIGLNAAVVKFRIPAKSKGDLATHLAKMNVRNLVLFPDELGFSGMLNDLVPRQVSPLND